MTEKIIIDGVDVSECDNLKYDHIGCDIDQTYCLGNDCHFKQFERITQEVKRWKHQAVLGRYTVDRLTKDIERLSDENGKLKSQIKNEKQALQIDIDNLNQACLDLNQENDDLLNKLQTKEQECEELKKQHEQYKPFYELGAKCTQLNEVADGLSNKCEQYKQALDEIKKELIPICESCRKYYTNRHCEECDTGAIKDIINNAKAVSNAR